MARRATAIDEVRGYTQHPILVLDSGNTLLGQRLANETEGRVIVEAMNAMGYDAMTVGAMDLQTGLDVLNARAAEADFAVLSCNIVGHQDGQPLFAPYVVLERGGFRFGILGVSEPDIGSLPVVEGLVEVIDPKTAVQKHLAELRSKSDVVILLSHLGLEADAALAQAVPGINVIVGGRSRQILVPAQIVGQTVIVQAGFDGEFLGHLDVAFDAQGQPTASEVRMNGLGPEVADDAAMVALLASYQPQVAAPTTAPE